MERKITCPCGRAFTAEAAEEIDLGVNPEYIEQIMSGAFMNFVCPGCGKKHRPEFPVTVVWPDKGRRFEVLPELERGAFYRRKKDPPDTETIIGYPELADRVAVIRDGLEPAVVEALKYYILLKAEEDYPDQETFVWYEGTGPGGIEFHLHGIRDDEVAVIRTPPGLYEKTLDDYRKRPNGEIFSALKVRSCLSAQNTRRGEI